MSITSMLLNEWNPKAFRLIKSSDLFHSQLPDIGLHKSYNLGLSKTNLANEEIPDIVW